MSLSLLLAASIGFSLIVAVPDLLSWMNHPDRWVPVNSPPASVGDDYHYYSVLNLFHRACLRRLSRKPQCVVGLSAASWLTVTTLLFNIVPYHVGYVLGDRRSAVTVVRMWNHAVFFFATGLVAHFIFSMLRVDGPDAAIVLTAALHYVAYPTLLTFAARSSILFNLGSNDHIYRSGQPNDISRAFNLATSGCLCMIAVAWLVVPEEVLAAGPLHASGVLLLNALLYFAYLPIACVFGLLSVVHFGVVERSMSLTGGAIAINVACLAVYFWIAARDRIMKEVVVHHDEGKLLTVSRRTAVEAAAVLGAPWLVYLVTPAMPLRYMALLVAASLCVMTLFLNKHQGSRFWDRGAILIYQLLLLTWIVSQLWTYGVGEVWMMTALAVVAFALARYEYRNAKQLITSENKLAPQWIADGGYLTANSRPGEIIATDSIDLAYYVFLYTGHYSLLKNYSVQTHGYRENLEEFCLNFKLLGYDVDDVAKMFSMRCDASDWVSKRLQLRSDSRARSRAVIYALQFMATYHDFNQSLRDEAMYVGGEWTDEMRKLIRKIWACADADRECRVVLDPRADVRQALDNCGNEWRVPPSPDFSSKTLSR